MCGRATRTCGRNGRDFQRQFPYWHRARDVAILPVWLRVPANPAPTRNASGSGCCPIRRSPPAGQRARTTPNRRRPKTKSSRRAMVRPRAATDFARAPPTTRGQLDAVAAVFASLMIGLQARRPRRQTKGAPNGSRHRSNGSRKKGSLAFSIHTPRTCWAWAIRRFPFGGKHSRMTIQKSCMWSTCWR